MVSVSQAKASAKAVSNGDISILPSGGLNSNENRKTFFGDSLRRKKYISDPSLLPEKHDEPILCNKIQNLKKNNFRLIKQQSVLSNSIFLDNEDINSVILKDNNSKNKIRKNKNTGKSTSLETITTNDKLSSKNNLPQTRLK